MRNHAPGKGTRCSEYRRTTLAKGYACRHFGVPSRHNHMKSCVDQWDCSVEKPVSWQTLNLKSLVLLQSHPRSGSGELLPAAAASASPPPQFHPSFHPVSYGDEVSRAAVAPGASVTHQQRRRTSGTRSTDTGSASPHSTGGVSPTLTRLEKLEHLGDTAERFGCSYRQAGRLGHSW
jgi:hypothetical protein